jgi:hypothetical protein
MGQECVDEVLFVICITNDGQVGTNRSAFIIYYVATFTIGFFFVFKDFSAVDYVAATGCRKLTVLFSKRQYLAWWIS